MGIALGDLQVGPQRRQIDGGRALTHTAAYLLDALAADVSGGGQKAAGGLPAAHQAVVRELFTGHDDRTVKEFGRQLNIFHAVDRPGDVRRAGAQRILIELTGEFCHGNRGLGDGQGQRALLAPIHGVKGLLGLVGVKAHAHAVLLKNFLRLVKLGVLHRLLDLGQNIRQVQGLRGQLLQADVKLCLRPGEGDDVVLPQVR